MNELATEDTEGTEKASRGFPRILTDRIFFVFSDPGPVALRGVSEAGAACRNPERSEGPQQRAGGGRGIRILDPY